MYHYHHSTWGRASLSVIYSVWHREERGLHINTSHSLVLVMVCHENFTFTLRSKYPRGLTLYIHPYVQIPRPGGGVWCSHAMVILSLQSTHQLWFLSHAGQSVSPPLPFLLHNINIDHNSCDSLTSLFSARILYQLVLDYIIMRLTININCTF